MAGLNARIPTLPEGETHIYYQDLSAVRLVIDQERWQALLDAMGHDDFVIPKSADGAEVVINIPSGVIVAIGDCQFNEIDEVKLAHPDTEDCTVFLQSTSPTIEAPPGWISTGPAKSCCARWGCLPLRPRSSAPRSIGPPPWSSPSPAMWNTATSAWKG